MIVQEEEDCEVNSSGPPVEDRDGPLVFSPV
jgi:hypothetical protein